MYIVLSPSSPPDLDSKPGLTHLHAHHAIDEEDEGDEESDPGQRLEGLDEGPEQGSDPLTLLNPTPTFIILY